jgi:hypothetical protein
MVRLSDILLWLPKKWPRVWLLICFCSFGIPLHGAQADEVNQLINNLGSTKMPMIARGSS